MRAWIALFPDSGDWGPEGTTFPAVVTPTGTVFGPAHFLGMLRCRIYGLTHGYGWLKVKTDA